MSLSVVTNVPSLIAQENLRVNNDFQSRTIERLTSGYRINASGDDAAGLTVANKYRSDIAELTQGIRNANDGLSVLQIVDGGLNNIAKMLDRMKTLATQSASTTFTGDRDVLNNEYSALKTEIDRQAANIGLGSGTTEASRYNVDLSVYIGGGAGQTNAKASIDLSGTSSLVTSTSLGLSGTSVDGSASNVQLVAGTFDDGSKYLDADSSQTFRFATATSVYSVTVQGDTDGLTGDEIVTQLNNGLAGSGLTVSINSTNHDLEVGGSAAFAAAIDARNGTGTVISAAVADDSAKVNTGQYRFAGGTVTAAAGVGSGTITFTQGSNTYTVTLTTGDAKETIINNVRAALSASDISVLRLGDELYFQSGSTFSVGRTNDTVTGGIENITDAMATTNATAASASTDATTNAKAALTLIADALDDLGTVQGKVGSGQNKLQYAIQLAQSQIANYSAAESRIRDADMAAEAANLTRAQVLQQASMAAMAQANAAPQAVLALLRG